MTKRIALSALAGSVLFAAALAAAEAAAAPAAPGKVNINQASATQLALLPRIGASAAERIVEYRKQHGSFGRPEELMEVKGIGEKLFLVLKPYVSLSGPTTITEKIRSAGARSRGASRKPAAPSVPAGRGR